MANTAIVATYTIYVCENLTRGGRPFALVENIVCAPSHRRQGIGTALMEHAKAYLEAKVASKSPCNPAQIGRRTVPSMSRAGSPVTSGATKFASIRSAAPVEKEPCASRRTHALATADV